MRIWKGFCLALLGVLVADSARAERNNREGDDFRLPHLLVKRQQPIGEFKSVVCNRTIWKNTFEPYLKAEGRLQRDPKNEALRAEFDTVLDNLNRWKNTNIQRLHEACGLQKFLECGEDLKCVCGTGNVPYSFEAKDAWTCLAKRGSICLNDKDCAAGLVCQERYCGGSGAFLEESKGITDSGTNNKINTILAASLLSFILANRE